jgi:hypothetical protein
MFTLLARASRPCAAFPSWLFISCPHCWRITGVKVNWPVSLNTGMAFGLWNRSTFPRNESLYSRFGLHYQRYSSKSCSLYSDVDNVLCQILPIPEPIQAHCSNISGVMWCGDSCPCSRRCPSCFSDSTRILVRFSVSHLSTWCVLVRQLVFSSSSPSMAGASSLWPVLPLHIKIRHSHPIGRYLHRHPLLVAGLRDIDLMVCLLIQIAEE